MKMSAETWQTAGSRRKAKAAEMALELQTLLELPLAHPHLNPIRNLKCCFHFQMEFLKVKLNALQQKAQMFSYEINGALKNTLHNMIG